MSSMMNVSAVNLPKKQRRRKVATNSGAADDCFACQSRNQKCDRLRPYCQQCLDMGKECSGYKQALTWGVGIASRGKMRGLSSPAAHRPSQETRSKPSSKANKRIVAKPSSPPTAKSISTPVPEVLVLPTHTRDWCLPSSSQGDDWSHISNLGSAYEVFDFLPPPQSTLSPSLGAGSSESDQDWPSPQEPFQVADYLYAPGTYNGTTRLPVTSCPSTLELGMNYSEAVTFDGTPQGLVYDRPGFPINPQDYYPNMMPSSA